MVPRRTMYITIVLTSEEMSTIQVILPHTLSIAFASDQVHIGFGIMLIAAGHVSAGDWNIVALLYVPDHRVSRRRAAERYGAENLLGENWGTDSECGTCKGVYCTGNAQFSLIAE